MWRGRPARVRRVAHPSASGVQTCGAPSLPRSCGEWHTQARFWLERDFPKARRGSLALSVAARMGTTDSKFQDVNRSPSLKSSTALPVLKMDYDGDDKHRHDGGHNKNRHNPAQGTRFGGLSWQWSRKRRRSLRGCRIWQRIGCWRNRCGFGPRLVAQLDDNRIRQWRHTICRGRHQIQHDARCGGIRAEKSDANVFQFSTIDQDFLQSRSGPRLRQVDNQPVRVSHGLSARGDRLGCGNLDVKILILAADSNVANGRSLLASLNQSRTTAKHKRTDCQRLRCERE